MNWLNTIRNNVSDIKQSIPSGVLLVGAAKTRTATMGPRFGDPEDARPYYKATKILFDQILKADISHVEMRYLSMGMSNSYRIAIEEGANIIRIGTLFFV